jgi:hypothetical protein
MGMVAANVNISCQERMKKFFAAGRPAGRGMCQRWENRRPNRWVDLTAATLPLS